MVIAADVSSPRIPSRLAREASATSDNAAEVFAPFDGSSLGRLSGLADVEAANPHILSLSPPLLWPETTIATAAVQLALGGDRMMKVSRTPEVYADAADEVLTKPAREYTGRTLIVEQVLRDTGVTDFFRYAATSGMPDSELFPDIFLD